MNKYYHPDTDFWRKYNVAPPEATSHQVVDTFESPLSEKLKQLLPNSWKLEGNKLSGMTEMGELVQFIPTDYILIGKDSRGLPVFQKVVLQ